MLPTHTALPQTVIERNKAMNWLLKNFPNAFDLCNRKPLKSNILEDINSQEIADKPSSQALELAFNYYSHWASYLGAIKKDAACFDLYGKEIGRVTKEQEIEAQKILAIEKEKVMGA